MYYFKLKKMENGLVTIDSVIDSVEGLNSNDFLAIETKDTFNQINNDLSNKSKILTVDLISKKINVHENIDSFNFFDPGSLKEQTALRLTDEFNKLITPIDNLNIINYMDLKFKLADKGFFITDDNTEEKYLEILETDDEYLIILLEEYLISQSKIRKINQLHSIYNSSISKLNDIEDIDEISKLSLF
jgi:hypothetical protein